MTEADRKIEAFFAPDKPWAAELNILRSLLLAAPLTEIFKWRGPCYCLDGGNVATLWGFKEAVVLGFFKGVLMPDPAAMLVAPGENSRAVRMVKFTSLAEITAATPTLQSYIQAAIVVERSGQKITFAKDDLPYPEELIAALEDKPDLALAWDSLTPGRRRGWLLHFNQPKQSATKQTRIEKASPRILIGKGLNDR